jgi:diguanylate cyclase
MPSAIDNKSPRGFGLVKRIYFARAFALGFGILAVAAVCYQRHLPAPVWVALALHGYVWPHLAYWVAKRAKQPYVVEMRSVLLDNFLVACWVPAMAFNLLPSVVIIAMMAMSSVGIGDVKLLVRGVVAQLLGIGAGVLIFGWHWAPLSTQFNVIATLPIIVFYPLAIGAVTFRLATRLSQQKKAIEDLSHHDGLSGLLNRLYWEQLVSDEFNRCQRLHMPASLIMVDIDHFKMVNDREGHAGGDTAIRRFAELLQINLREIDRAGRYGGEEFSILLPDTLLPQAVEVAERLRAMLHQRPLSEHGVVTASFGVAELQEDFRDHGAWLQCADAALYAAKRQGRDCVVAHMSRST